MGFGFEEEAEDVALGEGGEDGGEAEVTGLVGSRGTGDGEDFGFGCFEGCDFLSGGVGSGEDEKVVLCGED